MKKNTNFNIYLILVVFISSFATQKLAAGEYTISFTTSGIVSTLDSIVVINQTKGTKVILNQGDALGLNVVASINQLSDNREVISIYPNPITEKSTISFYANNAGATLIKAISLDGKTVAQTTKNVAAGNNSLQVSLPKGTYLISIDGKGFSYSAKAFSKSSNTNQASIKLTTAEQTQPKGIQKNKSATINMEYQTGDKMQYKGYSGKYCNTIADVPTATKTVNFKYAECKDASGNYYYNFVTIGGQVWMIDNLRTSKFNNGNSFNNYTLDDTWKNLESVRKTPGWCNLNNDPANDLKYGKLYNFSATSDERGINPVGWHLPTSDEFQIFQDTLIALGYEYFAPSAYNSLNKALAGNTDWESNTVDGTPGNDLSKNNSTGFNALPGGYRAANGVFYAGRVAYWSGSGNGYTSTMMLVTGDWKNLYISSYPNQTGAYIRCIMD